MYVYWVVPVCLLIPAGIPARKHRAAGLAASPLAAIHRSVGSRI